MWDRESRKTAGVGLWDKIPLYTHNYFYIKIYVIESIEKFSVREKREKMSHSPTTTQIRELNCIFYVGHVYESTTMAQVRSLLSHRGG